MTPAQTALVDRLRALLVDEPVQRVVSMFGGRSFMVNDKMIVSALKGGGLGTRYTVKIRGKEVYLFEDEGRWFVEKDNGK